MLENKIHPVSYLWDVHVTVRSNWVAFVSYKVVKLRQFVLEIMSPDTIVTTTCTSISTTTHTDNRVSVAVQLDKVATSRLVVQLIHILCDQSWYSTFSLETGQRMMGGIRFKAWKSRPSRKVSCPVTLSDGGQPKEIHVLHGSTVCASVHANALGTIVGNSYDTHPIVNISFIVATEGMRFSDE